MIQTFRTMLGCLMVTSSINLMSIGCDGIGRALVAEFPPGDKADPLCPKPTDCDGSIYPLDSIPSTIGDSRIAACSEQPFRSYSNYIISVMIDGLVETDRGYFEDVVFGLNEPTYIRVWDAYFRSVVFCRESRSIQMGGQPNLSCTACKTDYFNRSTAVCLLPNALPTFDYENCTVFEQLDECQEPIPIRSRP